jgi:hypothetical protein
MPTLVITVNGPFAYVDDHMKNGYVTLMAPMCPQHVAGISSIESGNQYVFPKTMVNCRNHPANLGGCKAHLYELRLKVGHVGSPKWIGNYLPCQPSQRTFDPKAWRFWLKLPKPNILVAVNPVDAVIITSGTETIPPGPYAVGVRFIYKHWDGKKISLLYCGKEAESFKLCDYGDRHAYLDFEYSSPLRDDPDHEDAVNCFENLMAGLGIPWSIYIPNQRPGPEASKLNDCKSAIAWIG